MRQFDAKHRASPDFVDWEKKANQKFAAEFEGKLYPPKAIISIATGAERGTFSGGEQSNSYLAERGITIRSLNVGRALTGLHDALAAILAKYEAATSRPFTKADSITPRFEAAVDSLQSSAPVTSRPTVQVDYSTGKGRWAEVPWISLMDERETVTTQRGRYVVYLFRADLSGVYLTLNQGVTETIDELGTALGLQRLRERASEIRESVPGLAAHGFELTNSINLESGRLGRQYEASTVAHKFYPIDSMPSDPELEKDLEAVLEAYEMVLGNPGVARVTGARRKAPEDIAASTASIQPAALCDAFSSALLQAGLSFGGDHDTIVRCFVASVLTKPFVILTGLSGSGKTQLALKFGEWLGEGRFDVIPVRPDWTGPESLFGYEDALLPLEEDRRAWNVPDALKLILRAARDPEHPYILILDEMNLAHVERYFADVLSGLESRQAVVPNLRQDANGHWRVPKEQPAKVELPRNLVIAGTVNVDETTYMFSPKVLDRANTIEFRVTTDALPEDPSLLARPTRCSPASDQEVRSLLSVLLDDSWQARDAQQLRSAAALIRQVHAGLLPHSFEFGHRTYYEALRLIALLHACGITDASDAMDIFLLQKVLPRIHGARRKVEPVLRSLGAFAFERRAMSESTASFDVLTPPSGKAPAMRRSFAKISRMMRNLLANQFVSFAD